MLIGNVEKHPELLYGQPAPVAAAPSGGALGSVKGEAQGGKKLEAETVSADTLDFLKKYQ